MKNYLFLLLMFAGASLFANESDPVKKSLNIGESVITWKGKKVTGSHTGNISIQEGGLEFDEAGLLSGGYFVIDMNTITCTDLGEGGAKKLVGHLKSDDFFGVANFPTSKFEITKVVSRGTPGSYKIVGNLTIKETTKEIKFQADLTDSSASAEITVDRSDFDVRYGSGSFFDNLGDKTIYDEFHLTVNLAF